MEILLEGNAPQLANSVTEVARNITYKYNEDLSQLTITTIKTETILYPYNIPLSGKMSENKQTVTTTSQVYNVVVYPSAKPHLV